MTLSLREWYIQVMLWKGWMKTISDSFPRRTEMINVGGYKVNPHEVEKAIK